MSWAKMCPALAVAGASIEVEMSLGLEFLGQAGRPPGRPRRRCLRRQSQVGEDFFDYLGVLDRGDDLHRLTAEKAGIEVDPEYAFEELGPVDFGFRRPWCGVIVDLGS